jgi:Flp pilus assembly protein TadG
MPVNPPRRRARRRAGVTLELLLVFPILLALLLAMIQFSMLLVARQQLTGASREAARVAAQGGDLSAVQAAASLYLGQGNLSNAQVQAVLTDPAGLPLPSGAPVSVTVQVPAIQAAPDLLAFVGVSLKDEVLSAQTVMRKE